MPTPEDYKYKIDHLLVALDHVQRWGLAIDVGAHHGVYTMLLAGRFRHVVAYEPCSFEVLQRNTRRATNVRIRRAAVSDVAGRTKLWRKEKVRSGNTQGCYIGDTGEVLVDEDLPVVRLDDLSFLYSINFLKIDVEGMELNVLKGAKTCVTRDRPVIMIEAVDRYLRKRGSTSKPELFSWLTQRGYRGVQVIGEDHICVPT